MRHRQASESLGAYVLGALSESEKDAVEKHLAGCERCREEVARLRPATDALPASVAPVTPPLELKQRVMEAVRSEPAATAAPEPDPAVPPARASGRLERLGSGGVTLRLRHLALAGGVAFALGLGIAVGVALNGGNGGGTSTVAVKPTPAAHSATGELVSFDDQRGAVLRVEGLPQAPPGKAYEVWLERGGQVRSAAVFSVGRDGTGTAGIDHDLSGVERVLVTTEDSGGSPSGRPTSPPVARADLRT